ncbi:MAG: class I SAM-dependent methyltransferase [Gemmatimonadaceae bacterium]
MRSPTISRPTPPALQVVDRASCKCCGTTALPYGSVDFNRTCEDHKAPVFSPAGLGVRYHRCSKCDFIFTVAFDRFSPGDFHRFIYNDGYALADPDFVEHRPRVNAETLARRFFAGQPEISVLDYGGGNGLLAQVLGSYGFARALSYDPFYEGSRRPSGSFDLVTAFEVLEHTPTPYDTLKEMRWFMGDRGMMFFTTLLQPADIDRQGLGWWYASPRNGHVSLYSRASLTALMDRLGLTWGSCSELIHVAFRKKPPRFAAHLFGSGPSPA